MARRKTDLPGSFEDRCAAIADAKRKSVEELPQGAKRDRLQREIQQLETATRISDWLSSPGLQSPK